MNFLIYREYRNFSGIWQVGAVHAVVVYLWPRYRPSQDTTTCTIDRVANMYPNEGDGPSIFSTPSLHHSSHGWLNYATSTPHSKLKQLTSTDTCGAQARRGHNS